MARFPVPSGSVTLFCDGQLQDDGTFTVRVLLAGIKTPDDGRRVAAWLRNLISTNMKHKLEDVDEAASKQVPVPRKRPRTSVRRKNKRRRR